jgi:hypothetical protein
LKENGGGTAVKQFMMFMKKLLRDTGFFEEAERRRLNSTKKMAKVGRRANQNLRYSYTGYD